MGAGASASPNKDFLVRLFDRNNTLGRKKIRNSDSTGNNNNFNSVLPDVDYTPKKGTLIKERKRELTDISNRYPFSQTLPQEVNIDFSTDHVLDSVYVRKWLSENIAGEMFDTLMKIGEDKFPESSRRTGNLKYPLCCLYYGLKRPLDGTLALDRWGSDYESWLRLEEPPKILADCCANLRKYFGLSEYSVNSMLVNFYFDGDNMYIPAHRDTTACLEDGSSVLCLSLGATRDFVLCDNNDAGKYKTEEMAVYHRWEVSHGDLFALGPETNKKYCHTVPKAPGITKTRIAVIFRSVAKSFLDLCTPIEKSVLYASGKSKTFAAECITCIGYEDPGVREHVADMVDTRERRKEAKAAKDKEKVAAEDERRRLSKFYMGEGDMVPKSLLQAIEV